MIADCYSCTQEARFPDLPPREAVAADRHWRAAHAIGVALPGWLVLVPRRHVTAIADLTDAEAATLGAWQVRLSRALREVTGCARTYVAQFAEKPGFGHVHFHVVPRPADLPPEHRGPGVFALMRDAVSPQEADALAARLSAALRDR
ncbi:hypothetical protein Val02_18140 [Virgisporangium aliadipatigenens]|uniref:HIT domain-containing protein n=1 Tax=Virgisporangium aliadipatigenens TaxID=741659 RepID=A0A8J3YIR3_9ACTN|nr:HIT family protein [Virgisporangium aliadipatigenens]GIJ44928.1 hypothetical protein Val02_18140 [Virgisporangium aliadipatigenens]